MSKKIRRIIRLEKQIENGNEAASAEWEKLTATLTKVEEWELYQAQHKGIRLA